MPFPVIYLGLSQDRYDSGVVLVRDGRLVYAANEERFTRHKCQGGFPYQALATAFAQTGISPAEVDRVAIAGLHTPPLPVRLWPGLHSLLFKGDRTGQHPVREWLVDRLSHHTSIASPGTSSYLGQWTERLRQPGVRRTLPARLRQQPLDFVDHHTAHAAGARYLSGFDRALCLTADGYGDGQSLTVSRWAADRHEQLFSLSLHDSLGLFYEDVTHALGFIPNRHEGKVTGLAARGDWRRIDLPSPFHRDGDQLRYDGPRGRQAVIWLRDHLCSRHRQEDVASWVQHLLEENILAIASKWLLRSGETSLAVAGGVFANVRLNQLLHQLPQVENFFVHPNMGDGGLAAGAVAALGGIQCEPLPHVFLGDHFSQEEIQRDLAAAQIQPQSCEDVAERTAAMVASGHLVARFDGAMEWGPRALGNRSVLARADDKQGVERLNRLLRRSDFMPFAPAVLAEDADEYFEGLDGARHAAEFMTVCFDATARMRRTHEAAVHVDGSVRAQLVAHERNPVFHRLLQAYKAHTGHGLLLNTSFNIHEEPIVRTPAQAIAAFQNAELDYLAIGNFLVPAAHIVRRAESTAMRASA